MQKLSKMILKCVNNQQQLKRTTAKGQEKNIKKKSCHQYQQSLWNNNFMLKICHYATWQKRRQQQQKQLQRKKRKRQKYQCRKLKTILLCECETNRNVVLLLNYIIWETPLEASYNNKYKYKNSNSNNLNVINKHDENEEQMQLKQKTQLRQLTKQQQKQQQQHFIINENAKLYKIFEKDDKEELEQGEKKKDGKVHAYLLWQEENHFEILEITCSKKFIEFSKNLINFMQQKIITAIIIIYIKAKDKLDKSNRKNVYKIKNLFEHQEMQCFMHNNHNKIYNESNALLLLSVLLLAEDGGEIKGIGSYFMSNNNKKIVYNNYNNNNNNNNNNNENNNNKNINIYYTANFMKFQYNKNYIGIDYVSKKFIATVLIIFQEEQQQQITPTLPPTTYTTISINQMPIPPKPAIIKPTTKAITTRTSSTSRAVPTSFKKIGKIIISPKKPLILPKFKHHVKEQHAQLEAAKTQTEAKVAANNIKCKWQTLLHHQQQKPPTQNQQQQQQQQYKKAQQQEKYENIVKANKYECKNNSNSKVNDNGNKDLIKEYKQQTTRETYNKMNNNNYNNDTKLININKIMSKNLNSIRLILFTLLVIYSCPCGESLRLANGGISKSGTANKEQLNIGLIAPHTNFGKREYLRAINTAVQGLTKTRGAKLTFLENYSFQPRNIHFDMMSLTPSPTAILSTLCKEFLQVNVSAILYMMNNEQFGHSTASAQYFLQLAGYLGIPVISWNADNSGLERRASQSTLQLQLAPSIEHQSAAMLSILERYKWHQFSIVTSQIAGHDDFVQAVRERVAEMQDHFKFTILNAIVVTRSSDLMELVNSEARVMLLYATQSEAITILSAAEDMRLTGENYVWVVSQSVIEKKDAHPQFPVGMLGVHFDTSSAALMNEISNAIKIYGYGVEAYLTDPANRARRLTTQSVSCDDEGRGHWDNGETFFRYLRNVSIEGDTNKPNIEFTADGDLKSAELKIMNLRPSANSKNLVWEEIGVWKSWETQKLDIRDIAWPGNSHAPPQGVPEKFHLKITFLEEAPYINLSPADPVSGKCLMDRGVLCRVAADHEMAADMDMGQAHRNESFYQCCSGFCIDLLEKFAEELGFTYELVRVEDGKWGTLQNGKWNGLIADLVNRKTDMVLTSLMINTEREAVIDFSEPFMETGIAIVVAKRTGIISPTAFLEPFDTASWMLVGIVAIQAATFMIFLFEWLSPSGYDMKLYLQNTNAKIPYRFSLFRTYWLVWAVLFQAAVHVDSPRGFTSRFMTNVWALFAVVFLAIYTANLAAFMITREEFHEFSGLNDSRLVHPYSQKPSFRYGTIPFSHTDSTINKYFRDMAYYMRQYNKSSVADGVAAVLNGGLDAFIYDGTVLDYLVAQDEDCRLMTVGSWYAMTGYGLAFSRNSKYVQMFNKRLLEFRANGDLERLRRYWMTGSCRPGKQEHKSSDPLALEQFLSAFLLLMAGILLAALLLLLEHIYFKYIPKRLAKKDGGHCCALISLSMGKSLTFRGAVHEATEILKKHRCNDPICDTHLWKVKHELDMSELRVRQLEKTLDQHGIKPPQLRLASSTDLLNHHHLKERPPLLGNLSLAASAQDLYRWSYTTEIAEMETVL